MSSSLIMQVTLALSAAFWGTATCQKSYIVKGEGIYQKGEAIKTINRLLQQGHVPDDVIAAVASLGNVAVSSPGCLSFSQAYAQCNPRVAGDRGSF